MTELDMRQNNDRTDGEQFLRLQLNDSAQALLRLGAVSEVLSVPIERITPIPYMPEFTLGLLNQRSRIIWVVDLPQMLDLKAFELNRQLLNVAIIKSGKSSLALVVDEIKNVARYPNEAIQSPVGEVKAGLVPYLQGRIIEAEEVLWVLEPSSIINSPLFGAELSFSRN